MTLWEIFESEADTKWVDHGWGQSGGFVVDGVPCIHESVAFTEFEQS